GTTLGSLGAVTASPWYELDVTDAVTGNGTHSFALTSSSTDGADYDAREAGWNGPQLILDLVATDAGDPVLVGAADIALCSSTGDEATANLLDGIDGTIFTAGDNAQGTGATGEYTDCYASSWGRHKARIRPVPGNHDHATSGAAGYYSYFGPLAGAAGQGYYSYDLGEWHVVALNSNCSSVGGCNAGSAQERWLRADLAASTKPCTVAYWHHPLFTSSSAHAPTTAVRPLFQALYDADVAYDAALDRLAQQAGLAA
ncbi:MAG: metallophosphoesterase, partial [Micromonosporaceae bacterium]|nr:metallophosphoesterase [Micromonosporaceae bacterium]